MEDEVEGSGDLCNLHIKYNGRERREPMDY